MQHILVPKHHRIFLVLLLGCFTASAQPDFTLPLVKPEKYRNKTLGSEKTEDKKFTLPRRVYQGMVTHYNFYYNATTKLNAIVEKAKLSHRDDYTKLLPFYNYTTQLTASDSAELDSVMYKATAGIVLHDLRNNYIDNMYLLIGQSYYYWRKFDSAYRIFQFINYNFFPKSKDDYLIVVGSNDRSAEGELNIGTKEKKGIAHRAFTKPPSRNDALLWLAKTYAEDSLYAEAYSLANLLRKDPLFPKRLHTRLDEVQAYVFYQQEQWDSTAFFLQKSLPNAADKTELARWEYLLAQLYAKTNQPALASTYFNKAKAHTTDPVLYIHARIYEAQLIKKEGGNSIEETLADLMKLSKKERFDGFEDVLYYAAAGMALQKGDTTQATRLLQKSVTYVTENEGTKNKAYLLLSDIAYAQRNYVLASSSLDSINYQDPALAEQSAQLQLKQQLLKELVKQLTIVKQQDSLQTVAKMNEKEMEAYLKALVRKLRKQRGLKEEVNYNPAILTSNTDQSAPVFTNAGSGNSWYFYNASQKAKGFSEFKGRWGNRPNIDNWRRQSAVDLVAGQISNNNNAAAPGDAADPNSIAEEDLTVDGLKANLPLTEEQLIASNKKILNALFEQGQIYKNQLEDYKEAALVFEEIWKRFSNYEQEEQTLFELYYCWQKAGNNEKSAYYLNQLNQKYPNGDLVKKINDAKNPSGNVKDAKTSAYESIYNLMIEGKFTDALQQKKTADSVYGTSYWTPQLLYIESLYHIQQKNDSTAVVTLNNIESKFPGTPMAEKAAVLKEVLGRRKEIEDYLTNTNIVRQTEDSVYIPFDDGPKVNKISQQTKTDSTTKIGISTQPQQNNANITRPKAPVQKVGNEKEERNNAGNVKLGNKPVTDTTRIKPIREIKVEMAYVYSPSEPYTVMMYFEEVDPIYITESKNAFQRYNAGSHGGENIPIKIYDTDKDLLYMELGAFTDVTTVLSYMEELKKNAKQIVPWLPAAKYNFVVISVRNLEILKSRKNIEEYKLFIRQYIKDKF
ncbi:MAG: hypothetical protein K2Q24_14285 [Chitinophagaceae bacterium]|nr:hypothetical protein [Chitinophagaceae bacterium]